MMAPGAVHSPRMVIEVCHIGQPRLLFFQSQGRYYYRFCDGRLCRISKKEFFQIVGEYKND